MAAFEDEEKDKKAFTVYLHKWGLTVGVHTAPGRRGPPFPWAEFENEKKKEQQLDHDRAGRWFDHTGWLVYHMRERMKTQEEAEALWERACGNITAFPLRDYDGEGDCKCTSVLCQGGKLRINLRCKGSGDDKIIARTRESESNTLRTGTKRKTNAQ